MEWLYNNRENIQILANIATILALIFAAIQLNKATKEYKVKNKTDEAKESIELTKYYMDNILDDIAFIKNAYKEVGLEKIFKRIKYTDLHYFDIQELEEIFTSEELKKIEEKLKSVDMELLKKIIDTSQKTTQEIAATIESIDSDNIDINLKNIPISKNLKNIKISTAKSTVLNKLEYFAMKFNVDIADEELVYQSLHQTYLSVVKLLYYDICKLNKKNKDKYYINIIELYNIWAQRYGDASLREKSLRESLVRKPKKIRK